MNRSSKIRKPAQKKAERARAARVLRQIAKAPNLEQGAWIAYQMKLQGFTLVSMAECAGVTFQMVHAVIYGKRTSGRVQKAIAQALLFEGWNELLAARQGVAA
ncbi:MAG TPA: hypothetical protein PLB91_01095 [Spirochaetales bacterium]|nr:hypothetical protein [Spirochaetales bacterium]